jgi:hypothetical protein
MLSRELAETFFERFLEDPKVHPGSSLVRGCESCAEHMVNILSGQSALQRIFYGRQTDDIKKLWIYAQNEQGNLDYITPLGAEGEKPAEYNFHVAVSLMSDQGEVIMDPVFFDSLMSREEWKSRFSSEHMPLHILESPPDCYTMTEARMLNQEPRNPLSSIFSRGKRELRLSFDQWSMNYQEREEDRPLPTHLLNGASERDYS